MWDYQKINGAVLADYLHNYKLKEHELEMETMGHFAHLIGVCRSIKNRFYS